MSNRLFFSVPLVLMGVLSGCIPKDSSTDDKIRAFYGNSPLGSMVVAGMNDDQKKLLLQQISETENNRNENRIKQKNTSTQALETEAFREAFNRNSISLFKQFIKSYPNSEKLSDAYFYIGELEFAAGNFNDAILAYDNSNKHSGPRKDISLVNKSNALLKINQIKEAQEQLEFIVKHSSDKVATEQARNILGQIETKKRKDIAYKSTIDALPNDRYGKLSIDIITKIWDERSRDELRENPALIGMLYKDVKSGVYQKIQPFVEKIREADGGNKNSLEYYSLGAKAYNDDIEAKKRDYLEQLASNETKLNADLYWYTGQINERKLKLSKLQSGTKEYAETVKELEHLNNELIPLNLAKDLIKQREQDATNRRIAQERDYQQRQLDQQRQAQQAQLEYQRKQLELQRQQAEALEEANNPLSLGNQLKSLQDYNNSNRMRTCSKVGGVVTCF